jgi:hypothetical protein
MQLTIDLPSNVADLLVQAAKKANRTPQEVLEDIVIQALRRRETNELRLRLQPKFELADDIFGDTCAPLL